MRYVFKEEEDQARLFEWAKLMSNKYPELKLLNASLSGVRLKPGQAKKAKKLGMVKGFPDIFLPVVIPGKYAGLFIELKREKGGKLTREQKAWLNALSAQGYKAVCCKGFEEAKKTIEEYIKEY